MGLGFRVKPKPYTLNPSNLKPFPETLNPDLGFEGLVV